MTASSRIPIDSIRNGSCLLRAVPQLARPAVSPLQQNADRACRSAATHIRHLTTHFHLPCTPLSSPRPADLHRHPMRSPSPVTSIALARRPARPSAQRNLHRLARGQKQSCCQRLSSADWIGIAPLRTHGAPVFPSGMNSNLPCLFQQNPCRSPLRAPQPRPYLR